MDNVNGEMLKMKIKEMGKKILKEKKQEDLLYIVEDGTCLDSNGTHYGNEKKIVIRLEPLMRDLKKIQKLSQENILHYAKIIFLHELGHEMDPHLPKTNKKLGEAQMQYFNALFLGENYQPFLKKCKKIIIAQEKVAWEYAEDNLSKKEKNKLYRQIKNYCLGTYFYLLRLLKYTHHLEDLFEIVRDINLPFKAPKFVFSFFDARQKKIKYNIETEMIEFNLPIIASYLKNEKKVEESKVLLLFQLLEETAHLHVEKEKSYEAIMNTLDEKEENAMFDEKNYEKALRCCLERKKIRMERFDKISAIVERIIRENQLLLDSAYRTYSRKKRIEEYEKESRYIDYHQRKLKKQKEKQLV